ncbi:MULTISPECIES: hypothetical protein [Streptomyces]|nr:hypothetical protein [Streptomyces flavotricini]
MNRAVAAHGLRPVVDRVHRFEEAHTACRAYATDAPFGKVVITMDGADGN